MENIPLGANVECADGPCGKSVSLIVNPITKKVTHVVVEDKKMEPPDPRLVPVEHVAETGHDVIRLTCAKHEVADMQSFIETRFVATPVPHAGVSPYIAMNDMPYVTVKQEVDYRVETVEHIPPGELAIYRGTRVVATDGHVGTVTELAIDPASGNVTHLVLEEGHLLRKKTELTLPLSVVDHVEGEHVYLKLDKKAIAKLPALPVQRSYGEGQGQVELIARVFDNPDKASEALEFVEGLRARKVLKILNAAVLVKDEDGEVSMKDTRDIDPKKGRVLGVITGGLVGLVGGPLGMVVGALAGLGAGGLAGRLVDFGFSDKFLKGLQDYLKPGTSALIVLVEDHWATAATESLKELGGVVMQQTLTDKLVEDLLEGAEEA